MNRSQITQRLNREGRLSLAVAISMCVFTMLLQAFTHGRVVIPGLGLIIVTIATGLLARLIPGIRRQPLLAWLLSALAGVGYLLAALPGNPVSTVRSGIDLIYDSRFPLGAHPDTTWCLLALLAVLIIATEFFVEGIRKPGLAIIPIAAGYFLVTMMPGRVMNPLRFACVVGSFLFILAMDTANRAFQWRRYLSRDTGHGNDSMHTIARLGSLLGLAVIGVALIVGANIPILPSTNVFNTDGMVQTEDPRIELNRSLRAVTPRPALRYQTSIPGGGLYLRRAALDQMSPTGWEISSFQSFRATGSEFTLPPDPGMTAPTIMRTTSVAVEESQQEYLPVPYAPHAINA
ncbi:MAG: DUF3488 domain-containing protein, partial [Propionibacteriaceae bacterium]